MSVAVDGTRFHSSMILVAGYAARRFLRFYLPGKGSKRTVCVIAAIATSSVWISASHGGSGDESKIMTRSPARIFLSVLVA